MTEHRVNPLQWLSTKFASLNHSHNEYLTNHQDISGKEDISSKVTSLSENSTNTQYPSAKCVYDTVDIVDDKVSVVYNTVSIIDTSDSVYDADRWTEYGTMTVGQSSSYKFIGGGSGNGYVIYNGNISNLDNYDITLNLRANRTGTNVYIDDNNIGTLPTSQTSILFKKRDGVVKVVYDDNQYDASAVKFISSNAMSMTKYTIDIVLYQGMIYDVIDSIPSKTSDLTNDSGFLTQHQSLSNYVTNNDSRLTDARTPTAHNHNDLYYTETETDNLLNGKSNTNHTHSQYLTQHQSLAGYLQTSDVKDNLTSTDTNKPLSAKQGKELKTLVDGKAGSSHTHNTTEIRDSSAYNRIGSGANDTQANINDSIDLALANIDDNILYTKMDLVGFDKFQVKDFINPNNWAIPGCTYSDGVLTFSGTNGFIATFPTDFELSFDYIIDDGLVLGDTFYFYIFGREAQYIVMEDDIDNGYVIIDVSFKSENNHGIITSEASGDEWRINYVSQGNPYTINAITPVGNSTKIANIRYKANDIISLNDNKEDVYNKVTSLSSSSTDTQYPSAKAVYDSLDVKEDKSNKVTSLSSSSTDTQYPSAKSVYDKCETKLDKLQRTVTTFNPIDYVVGENGAVWDNDNVITLPNNGSNITFNFTDMLNDTGDYFEWELGVSHGTIYMDDEEHIDEIWDSSVNSSIRIRITKNEYSESYHITTTDLSNNTIIKDYDKDYQFNLKFGTMNGCTFYFSSKKWYHTVSFIDMIYPIGSIYMSVNSINPSLFIGGTWEQIQDKFLLASGSTYSAGSTGGSATVALTKAQMPRHNHTQAQHRHKQMNKYSDGTGSAGAYTYSSNRKAVDHYTDYQTPVINHTGGTGTTNADANGSPHENMPPYLTVYMWKRTA